MDQAVHCAVHAILKPAVSRRLDTVSALLEKEVMTAQHVRSEILITNTFSSLKHTIINIRKLQI